MVFCSNCGLAMRDDEVFCIVCGNEARLGPKPYPEHKTPIIETVRREYLEAEKGRRAMVVNNSRPSRRRSIIHGSIGLLLIIIPLFIFLLYSFPNIPPQPLTKDGDRPKYELAPSNIQKIIKTEVDHLKPGQILFNPAQEMKVGQREKIEVRIAKSFTDDLWKGLTGRGFAQIEKIKVSPYMGVTLSGTEGFFDIALKNREQKIVGEDEYTEWIFDVLPLKQGNPSLYLNAYNVIDTPAGEKTYENPAFSREIKVTTTFAYTVANFLRDNWKELIGLLIASGIVGWLIKRILKRKEREKELAEWEHP